MKITFCLFFCFVIIFYNGICGDIKGTVVSPGEGELQNAVVYIEKIEGKKFNPPDKPALMDQKNLTFEPHVLPILVGTTVTFPNSDATRHSVFSPSKTKKFDFGTYSQGSQKSTLFDKPGVVSLLCHVHPEMSAFIVVVETPYFDVSNEKGFYQIKNVPAGKYKLTIWHEWAQSQTRSIEVQENKDITINFSIEE